MQDVMNPWKDRRCNNVKAWAKRAEEVIGSYINIKLEYIMRV